jgi:hypothetical protein
MKRFAIFAVLATLSAVLVGTFATPAEAQLSRGNLRLTVDADMLSIAGVERDPEGAGESDTTVFGIGPNQEGGAQISGRPTPFGLGVGYVLQPKLILGVRFGLGLDVISPDSSDNNTRRLGLSLMPNLTFVPVGKRAKLFLQAAPIFQVSRDKRDTAKERTILGGVGLGIGTFIFITNALSVDLGFHFEARLGGYEDSAGRDTRVRDLRGVFRLGVSLWT